MSGLLLSVTEPNYSLISLPLQQVFFYCNFFKYSKLIFEINILETVTSLSATKLTDVSTVSVSSVLPGTFYGKSLKLAQMLDGNQSTFWHSFDKNSWTRVVFDTTHTVTKVGFSVRPGTCTLCDQCYIKTYADKSMSLRLRVLVLLISSTFLK